MYGLPLKARSLNKRQKELKQTIMCALVDLMENGLDAVIKERVCKSEQDLADMISSILMRLNRDTLRMLFEKAELKDKKLINEILDNIFFVLKDEWLRSY